MFQLPKLLIISILCLASAAPLGAEPRRTRLGELGQPQQILFEGADAVSAEEIRKALESNFEYAIAAHPRASFSLFPNVLAQVVERGFHASGFPDASISVRFDNAQEKFVVRVDEGRRFVKGQVLVLGARKIDAKALIDWITHPHPNLGGVHYGYNLTKNETTADFKPAGKFSPGKPDPAVWSGTAPPSFAEPSWKSMQQEIRRGFAVQGYFFPKFRVEVRPDRERRTGNLVVLIADEGPIGKLSDIEIEGLQRNTRESLLEYLELSLGMTIDEHLRARTQARLNASARFRDVSVTPRIPTTFEEGVTLQIKAVEYEEAPLLSAPLTERQELLIKAVKSISEQWADEVLLDLAFDKPGVQISARYLMSRRDGTLGELIVRGPDKRPLLHYQYLRAGGKMVLSSILREAKLSTDDLDAMPKLMVRLSIDEQLDSRLDFQMALAGIGKTPAPSTPQFGVDVAIPEVMAMKWDYTFEDVQQEDAALRVIRNNECSLRIDARTGMLLESSEFYDDDGKSNGVSVRFQNDGFPAMLKSFQETGHYDNQYSERTPASSVMGFILTDLEQLSGLMPENAAMTRALLHLSQSLVSHGCLQFLDELNLNFRTHQKSQEEFSIPVHRQSEENPQIAMVESMAQVVLAGFSRIVPRDSAYWVLGREFTYTLLGKTEYTVLELQTLHASPQTGPLALLFGAGLWSIRSPQIALLLSQLGKTRLQLEDFRRDYRRLLQDDSMIGSVLRQCGAALRDLKDDDLQTLANFAFAEQDAGVRTKCLELIKSSDKKSPDDFIGGLLDMLWDTWLRDQAATAFDQLIQSGQQPATK